MKKTLISSISRLNFKSQIGIGSHEIFRNAAIKEAIKMKISDYYNWLKRDWAKIGLVLSLFMLVFLFVFVREKDFIVFLILLQTPLYMLHETEEYVFPGGFEIFFNRKIFKVESDTKPLNENFIFFINIIYIWISLPLFGILSLYKYDFGIWIPYFSFFAGVSHVLLGIKAKKIYNPGLIVSLILNIPVGAWTVYYLYSNKIINSLIINFHCAIGLGANLVLPIMGAIIYKRHIKKQTIG